MTSFPGRVYRCLPSFTSQSMAWKSFGLMMKQMNKRETKLNTHTAVLSSESTQRDQERRLRSWRIRCDRCGWSSDGSFRGSRPWRPCPIQRRRSRGRSWRRDGRHPVGVAIILRKVTKNNSKRDSEGKGSKKRKKMYSDGVLALTMSKNVPQLDALVARSGDSCQRRRPRRAHPWCEKRSGGWSDHCKMK